MKTSRLVNIAGKSILKNKMRTLLTMLGIIIGVGAVIVMVAVGQGAKSEIQKRIDNLGTNLIVVTPGALNLGGVSQGAGSSNRLTVADYEALKDQGLLLQYVSPMVMAFEHIVGGAGNWRTPITGVSADYPVVRDWKLASGRFFDVNEQRSSARVAVIGQTVANNLWPNQDPVGQEVRIGRAPFKIIGVLTAKGQTAEGNDQDDVVLTPYTTVITKLSRHQFIPQILASTASKDQIASAEAEMTDILRGTHKLSQYDPNDFTVRNQTDLAQAASGTTDVMTMLLAAIASISLLVGGIGIMNIMLVSVTERTREIGIRMAIGARGSDVLTQFLVEAIVMSVIGGLIGVALGYAGAAVLQRSTGWQTSIEPVMVGVAIGFSAAVGIFFGYYPARKAAALDPIQALRYE
ncbi:MAG: ABC transporter permease [Gemmatimonadota bacterium]|nr:ABC transporter permease [Gemmatimonadota bacterium]MDE3174360.1 ABC transporter permease [Gemmatimonadota bacterium]MDE3215419.1 ABC transporter permease [Gemmatimonadota bacterium]